MAKRRVTTHSKVASAPCTHVYVFARTPGRAGALPLSAPTWAARGVFSASCFVSERALPRAAEVLPEAVGAHPRFCVSAAKERAGAFREERSGRKRGRWGVAVSLGMSRPCGWLSTRSGRLVQTHRRGHSHDYFCTQTTASTLQVKSPVLKGNFRNQVWAEVMCTCAVV